MVSLTVARVKGRVVRVRVKVRILDVAGNTHSSSAQFLQTSNGRPLIVLSRLFKVKDSLLTFDEVVEFLQPFIQGRTDESSNGTPKRTFDLSIVRRVLTEVELDSCNFCQDRREGGGYVNCNVRSQFISVLREPTLDSYDCRKIKLYLFEPYIFLVNLFASLYFCYLSCALFC